MNELIYSFSYSGDKERCNSLLGKARNLLRIAEQQRQRIGVDSWVQSIQSDNDQYGIRVLSSASGNNLIYIEAATEGEEEELFAENRLLLHCKVILTLTGEIEDYKKDPGFIIFEPIEKSGTKIELNVFYDVYRNMEVVFPEVENNDDISTVERKLNDRNYKIVPKVLDDSGEIYNPFEIAEDYREDITEDIRNLNFIDESSYSTLADGGTELDGSLFYNNAENLDDTIFLARWFSCDIPAIQLPNFIDNWPEEFQDENGNIIDFGDFDYTQAPFFFAVMKSKGLKAKSGYMSLIDGNPIPSYSYSALYSSIDEAPVNIKYAKGLTLKNLVSHVYPDLRHLSYMGDVITDAGTGLYYIDDSGNQKAIDANRMSSIVPYYIECKDNDEILNNISYDFEGLSGSAYRTNGPFYFDLYLKVLGLFIGIGEPYNNDSLDFSTMATYAVNWLVHPYSTYQWNYAFQDRSFYAYDDLPDNHFRYTDPLSSGPYSKIQPPHHMTLCLRSFFANTENSTSFQFYRKSFNQKFYQAYCVNTEGVGEDTIYTYKKFPFLYETDLDDFEEVLCETSPPLDYNASETFLCTNGMLIRIDLLSVIYGQFNYAPLTEDSIDISNNYPDLIDFSSTIQTTDHRMPIVNTLGNPTLYNKIDTSGWEYESGKRTWPAFLDASECNYVNAYSAGISVLPLHEIVGASIHSYLYRNSFSNIASQIKSETFNKYITSEDNMYDYADTPESVLVNAIYRALEEGGYDKYHPVCDIKTESNLYELNTEESL